MHNATVSFKNVVETRYSQKSICRTVHRAPVLRRSRPLLTLKAQKTDHSMLGIPV
jgi:hypothetical protein